MRSKVLSNICHSRFICQRRGARYRFESACEFRVSLGPDIDKRDFQFVSEVFEHTSEIAVGVPLFVSPTINKLGHAIHLRIGQQIGQPFQDALGLCVSDPARMLGIGSRRGEKQR